MASTRETLDKSLNWIESSLSEFALTNAESSQERLKLLKPLGELVLTACLLNRFGIARDFVLHVSSWAWTELLLGEEIIDIFLVRSDLMALSSLYSNFEQMGYESPILRHILEEYSKSPGSMCVELPTWRKLNVRHSLDNLKLLDFPADPEKGIWLEKFPEPWKISEDISYAITHEVFYITDFGRKSFRLDAKIKEYLYLWVPAWLNIYLSHRNLDLVSEFIMVMECIGSKEDFSEYIEQISLAQDTDGLIQYYPTVFGNKLIKGNESEKRKKFLSNYHTTLVAILALAMTLNR